MTQSRLITQRPRILIVDDEPRMRKVLATMLEEYSLAVAGSAEEALRQVADFRPDLVLLDVELPDMDGFDVCRRIRADTKTRFVKVVFLSGNALTADRLTGYEAGGDDYITKPFNNHELLAKLRVMLRLKRTEEVDQIKNEFLSLITHETRTPINAVLTGTELAHEKGDSLGREELLEVLRRVRRAGWRLHRLAERTSLVCKLRSADSLPLSTCSIGDVLETAVAEAKELAAESKVTVRLAAVEGAVRANARYLSDAVYLLLENAIRFSPAGAEVTVTGGVEDGHYVLRISDRGKGIPRELLDSLFTLFSVHDVMHHKEGLGLSMVIAKWILALHGGDLTVSSVEGDGTTCVLRVPAGEGRE